MERDNQWKCETDIIKQKYGDCCNVLLPRSLLNEMDEIIISIGRRSIRMMTDLR